MPFIWNDKDWKLIHDGAQYDKKTFVVARKLFVRLRHMEHAAINSNYFNDELLKNAFQEFGVIESIELLNNGKAEAYVTFVNNASAHLAVVGMRSNVKLIVELADIWHQPIDNEAENDDNPTEEDPSTMLQLNEDCLIEVFKRCDIESKVSLASVCKLFKAILERHSFPRVDFVCLELDTITIDQIRNILRCVGAYAKTLVIRGGYFLTVDVRRCMQKVNQYIGENIRELQLIDLGCQVYINMSFITPIISRLHTLVVEGCGGFRVDFLAQSSDLTKLKISGSRLERGAAQIWPQSVTNLEYLSLEIKDFSTYFGPIVAQNPNLKRVKTYVEDITATTARNLQNVEKMTLYFEVPDDCLAHLTALQSLTKLTLSTLFVFHLETVFGHLKRLKNLCELKIFLRDNEGDRELFEEYQMPLVAIAQKLPRLEVFLLQGPALLKSTIFEFVRNATKLKALHIHHCKIWDEEHIGLMEEINAQDLVGEIVRARKSIDGLEIAPLTLHIDPELYNDLDSGSLKYDEKYLLIKSDCKHNNSFFDVGEEEEMYVDYGAYEEEGEEEEEEEDEEEEDRDPFYLAYEEEDEEMDFVYGLHEEEEVEEEEEEDLDLLDGAYEEEGEEEEDEEVMDLSDVAYEEEENEAMDEYSDSFQD